MMHAALYFTFIRKQENCVRSFINLHSFEHHLILKHSNQNGDVFVVSECIYLMIMFRRNYRII